MSGSLIELNHVVPTYHIFNFMDGDYSIRKKSNEKVVEFGQLALKTVSKWNWKRELLFWETGSQVYMAGLSTSSSKALIITEVFMCPEESCWSLSKRFLVFLKKRNDLKPFSGAIGRGCTYSTTWGKKIIPRKALEPINAGSELLAPTPMKIHLETT